MIQTSQEDARKPAIARWLRAETAVTLKWIAAELHMGSCIWQERYCPQRCCRAFRSAAHFPLERSLKGKRQVNHAAKPQA